MNSVKFLTVNRAIILVGDLFLLYSSYSIAYMLRFEELNPYLQPIYSKTLLPVVLAKLVILTVLGMHTGPWRYTGILDLMKIIKASVLGLLLVAGGMVFFAPGVGFPRSILLIDMILTICFIGTFRLSIRILYSRQMLLGVFTGLFGFKWYQERAISNSKRVLLYGANARGESLLRSILSSQEKLPYHVIGFIDDDPNVSGSVIHGIRNLGVVDNLTDIIERFRIDELMIASNPGKELMTKAYTICQQENVKCRVIPQYLDVLNNDVGVAQLKNVAIEDLLGREPANIDFTKVEGMYRDKRVIVTGAAGSIGKQLCRQLVKFRPSELVCVDLGESPLFYLQQELTEIAPNIKIVYYCSNVTDRAKVSSIFSKHKPHAVFHAAALKHVPLMEANMDEVIFNNISGTKNVADMAHENGAERFIFISTDKAVNPANVMGWTKRAGELYTTYMAGVSKTKFLAVRFGNVLGSNGSVIPIFKEQIRSGGPVKVTHRDVTRYFMTIPEAVLLILQSTLMGEAGDIMILDMGKPVKISVLAEDLIRLSGLTPGEDIEIAYTGLRPGEKLHEILMTANENLEPTEHKKITVLKRGKNRSFEINLVINKVIDICRTEPEQAYNLIRDSFTEKISAA
jgi:FlaA1/EpsC-like NDP-sugar epimerase